jgi:hypothetical protein
MADKQLMKQYWARRSLTLRDFGGLVLSIFVAELVAHTINMVFDFGWDQASVDVSAVAAVIVTFFFIRQARLPK